MHRLDKPLKALWLVNGVLMLSLFAVALVGEIARFFDRDDGSYPFWEESGPIVGERRAEATVRGLELQTIGLGEPVALAGSNYLMIPVNTLDYAEPLADASRALAVIDPGEEPVSSCRTLLRNQCNVVFYALDGRDTRILFDRQIFISRIQVEETGPGDLVLYWTVASDTNGDGRLSHGDDEILYVSDAAGRGLRRVDLPPGRVRWDTRDRATGDLVLIASVDSDGDGALTEYDGERAYRLDFATGDVTEVVDGTLYRRLKAIAFR